MTCLIKSLAYKTQIVVVIILEYHNQVAASNSLIIPYRGMETTPNPNATVFPMFKPNQ